MLKIDTELLRQYAHRFQNQLCSGFLFENSIQASRHESIQNSLLSIAQYLYQSASQYEKNDQSYHNTNGWNISTSSSLNLYSLLSKKEAGPTAKISAQKSVDQKQWSDQSKYHLASANLSLGNIAFQGQVESSLFKKGQFDPSIKVKANATASIVNATLYGKIGTNDIYADVKATGQIGAAYAKAEAVLSLEEQHVDVGVGASALKGEVEASFNIFGAKVSVSGQGSIGSAELNMSYHHSNREWEFGSKLGFIVGTGFKIKIQY